MEPTVLATLMVALGALVYNMWGYYQSGVEWEWKRFFETIVPPAVIAFSLAYTGQIEVGNTTDYFMHIMAGFGWAKLQNKIGLN